MEPVEIFDTSGNLLDGLLLDTVGMKALVKMACSGCGGSLLVTREMLPYYMDCGVREAHLVCHGAKEA